MSLTTVTITGDTYQDSAGNLLSGTITFVLTKPISNDGTVVPAVPITATVTNGTFTQALVATDDVDTVPQDAFYSVTEELNNGKDQVQSRDYTVQILSANGASQKLADLVPGLQIWQ